MVLKFWDEWIRCSCFTLLLIIKQTLTIDDMDYLSKYGYLPPSDKNSPSLISHNHYIKAIENFQKMAGLPVTGKLDPETKKTMGMPRCGVKDPIGTGNLARRKRYALHGSHWSKHEITYRITQYSRKLQTTDVENELQRAFDIWGEVIPVKFKRKEYGPVDIAIKFVSGHHGDNTPFDGRGQTLAHAYFPQYGGDAHFDEDERWTLNIPDGVNLFQVAAHEFGHSLGLAHSDVRSALMAPFYRGFDSNFRLDQDDVIAVQELYGTKDKPHFTTTKKPIVEQVTKEPLVSIPQICRNATVDAITRTYDGLTYIFQGNHYYRLSDGGFDKGYPRPIHWDWENIETPIDAALTWPNGWTFIFKGSLYWKFKNLKMMYGPKNISEGFDGIPSNIDAAFVWSGNGKTYFIKGNRYWRYYGNKIDYGYPRDLRIWRGLPERITSAFQWKNGRTYFFSGDKYYRYNDQLFDVDKGGYPREVGIWWFGCPDRLQIEAFDRQQHRRHSYTGDSADTKVAYNPFDAKKKKNDTLVINITGQPGYSESNGYQGIYSGACAFRTSGVSAFVCCAIIATLSWVVNSSRGYS